MPGYFPRVVLYCHGFKLIVRLDEPGSPNGSDTTGRDGRKPAVKLMAKAAGTSIRTFQRQLGEENKPFSELHKVVGLCRPTGKTVAPPLFFGNNPHRNVIFRDGGELALEVEPMVTILGERQSA